MTWREKYLNQIVCGDCLELMPELPAGTVDLILTDPPWFAPVATYTGRDVKRNYADFAPLIYWWERGYIKEAKRVLANTAWFLSFCGSVSLSVFYPTIYNFWKAVDVLVWDKGRIGMGRPWRKQYELIIAAHDEDYCKGDMATRADILKFTPINHTNRTHQAEKPVTLLSELIKATTAEGAIIFDPFVGTGATAVAAQKLNRNYIGLEINPDYCEIARKRLAQEVLINA